MEFCHELLELGSGIRPWFCHNLFLYVLSFWWFSSWVRVLSVWRTIWPLRLPLFPFQCCAAILSRSDFRRRNLRTQLLGRWEPLKIFNNLVWGCCSFYQLKILISNSIFTCLYQLILGGSGGVVNSHDFCLASLKSLGCFCFWCVLSSQWKAVAVNLRILHYQL